ncbi:MAG: Crp/Fnr family transcriptional regulator [Cyclobacteriaceae bacterium]|nr:Crp/Fnr family transcriptional regulator [Cyclobacteriaceae bacterium]
MVKPSKDIFKVLSSFTEPGLQTGILEHGSLAQAKKGDVLIKEGQYLNFLPIVIKGRIRVFQEKDDREILLYYVAKGETCMMSLSSAYFDYNSKANGIAMEPTELLVLPAFVIAEWQLRYPSWNRFIIQTFKARYDDLLQAFGDVAFKPIQARIKDYLASKVTENSSKQVAISHQTLANELGTTRVVVSRILKEMELDKVLTLHRGYIELT